MAEIDEMQSRHISYWRKLNKKLRGKPYPVITIQRRTLSTASEILDTICDIPFEKLSMSLYFYCQDVGMAQFTHAYESQIELAGANPDKFVFGLHEFYTRMASKIRKEDLYDLFFEFYYRCMKMRFKSSNEKIDDKVMIAYQNLLIQQLEYMRPSKFDLNVFVAGRKTTGEIMTRPDQFPTFDAAMYEFNDAIEQGQRFKDAEEYLYSLYRKHGYDINNETDQLIIVMQDKAHTTTCCTLLPFINEYTYDILPQTVFSTNTKLIMDILHQVDVSALKNALKKRKRTLPMAGVRINFSENPSVNYIILKEILYDNAVYMLYRLNTSDGDLSGLYETKDQFFSSILSSSESHQYLSDRIEALVLYCYASQVLRDYPLSEIGKYISVCGTELLSASCYSQGERLRNVYDRAPTTLNKENLEVGEASIQGYIRKLPAGHKASEEARELAESLGYDLEANETYVRPFIKQVFRLKEKDRG